MRAAGGSRPPLNLVAGLLLMGLAALALWLNQDLRLGTLARMGPGFLPTLLSIALALTGVLILVSGIARHEERIERLYPRPVVFVSLAVLVFGLLVEGWGLFPAAFASVMVAALSGAGNRPVETVALAVVVSLLVSAVFVLGLGLPLPIFPW